MRRQLAITAAKWLSKRENREKLKRAARQLKARMERETGAGATRTERPPGQRHDTHGNDRSRPGRRY